MPNRRERRTRAAGRRAPGTAVLGLLFWLTQPFGAAVAQPAADADLVREDCDAR